MGAIFAAINEKLPKDERKTIRAIELAIVNMDNELINTITEFSDNHTHPEVMAYFEKLIKETS
jgi:hypothetical protein